jgi:biotin transport system ATP-binding protein
VLIEVNGVSHVYPGRDDPALREVDVRLEEHRIGVIGANGSGKSTFARLLNGLVLPSRGTVTVGGWDTARDGREVR